MADQLRAGGSSDPTGGRSGAEVRTELRPGTPDRRHPLYGIQRERDADALPRGGSCTRTGVGFCSTALIETPAGSSFLRRRDMSNGSHGCLTNRLELAPAKGRAAELERAQSHFPTPKIYACCYGGHHRRL